jgi:antagonist of KipI
MGVIEVHEPGLFTTVQDLGREGFGPLGVSASGAADGVSLRIGNRLVGNEEGAPALEMTLLGGAFAFPDGAAIALAGSDFGATLDSQAVETWKTIKAGPGQVLRLGPTRSGARCYLCVRGGIEAKMFLGSASTHILSGLGGHEGRALKKGDVLRIGTADGAVRLQKLKPKTSKYLTPRKTLRVTAGPQSDWFSRAAQKAFYGRTFRVGEDSNRMGIRLEGEPIPASNVGEMTSEGVSLGAVQVTAAGLPIILFVEQQTTGGYPKIANVISADLHSVGQLRPRDEIRFEFVTMETARKRLLEQEEILRSKDLLVE